MAEIPWQILADWVSSRRARDPAASFSHANDGHGTGTVPAKVGRDLGTNGLLMEVSKTVCNLALPQDDNITILGYSVYGHTDTPILPAEAAPHVQN